MTRAIRDRRSFGSRSPELASSWSTNEALDAASEPPADAFTVVVNPGYRSAEVVGVEVSGSEVVLTLAQAVAGDNTVGLTYEVPVTGAIQDADSLEAVGVTWVTGPSDAPPVITTAAAALIFVEENETAVATLAATDADHLAEELTWRITGGTDRNRFKLTANGVLTFGVAQDYEAPGDSDRNNFYEVTVEVSDGANPVEAVFRVRVTDVDEQPGTPDAPTVAATAGTTNSLDVSWAAPATNGGPDLTGYEVIYRKGTNTDVWDFWPHSGTGTSATITRVDAGNEYQVQVRALNGETPSEWSVAGTGQTNALTTVISIEITSNPGSDRTYAAEDEIEVTVTFSEIVEVTGTPRLRLRVGSRNRTAGYRRGADTAELVFGYEVADSDLDTDGASIDAGRITVNGGSITDQAGNPAELTHEALPVQAGHKVDGVKPQLAATGGAVADGAALTLTYSEVLDSGSRPAAGDFTVAGGDSARTVSNVAVSGSTVELTLDPAAEHGEAGITVSYTPGTNPIRDTVGNKAEALSYEPVTNDTPDTTPPEVSSLAITSNPGSDQTYAAGDEIQVTVTFNETVEVTGSPQLQIELGGGGRTAIYEGGSGTAALVFAYEVADGESDTDGVGVEANSLSGGTIRDEARNNAELDHDGLTADSRHKVDGVRPVLTATGGAVVNGTTMTLTYDEQLDGSSTPASGDFTVSGGRSGADGLPCFGERQHGGADLGCWGRALGGRDTGELHTVDEPDPGHGGQQSGSAELRPVTNDTPDTTLAGGEQRRDHLDSSRQPGHLRDRRCD